MVIFNADAFVIFGTMESQRLINGAQWQVRAQKTPGRTGGQSSQGPIQDHFVATYFAATRLWIPM
jgi:hypothetical protein